MNEHILLKKAKTLSGFKLKTLALQVNANIPDNLKNNKGWIGQLLEKHLGVQSNNKAQQDFPHLGIELKTIPIDHDGSPLQTTFICSVPLIKNIGINWKNCYFRYKISKILWIPVEGNKFIPLSSRRIGHPFIWTPSDSENKILYQDWIELTNMVVLGNAKKINSNYGTYLQVRTKASNNKVRTASIGKYGKKIMIIPLAFYFRKNFTASVLKKYFDTTHYL